MTLELPTQKSEILSTGRRICLLQVSQNVFHGFFEMATLPFPCNGPLLCCFNLPQCFSINLLVVLYLISIFCIGDGLALAFNCFGSGKGSYNMSQNDQSQYIEYQFDPSKEKERKKKLATRPLLNHISY